MLELQRQPDGTGGGPTRRYVRATRGSRVSIRCSIKIFTIYKFTMYNLCTIGGCAANGYIFAPCVPSKREQILR